jgi:hypothetical protein
VRHWWRKEETEAARGGGEARALKGGNGGWEMTGGNSV